MLDRTEWKIGKRRVIYRVLAAVTRRFRAPPVERAAERRQQRDGGPDRADRALPRPLSPPGPSGCSSPTGSSSETKWLKFLDDSKIPFAIRLREDLRVVTEDGCELTLFARLRNSRRTRTFRARLWDDGAADGPILNFAVKRLPAEWLIVVSNRAPRCALAAYRGRWAIECLFGDAKTRGLTSRTPASPVRAARPAHGPRRPRARLGRPHRPRPARPRRAEAKGPRLPRRKSWFRIGFEHIRNLLRTDPETAIQSWLVLAKRRNAPRVW